jgi:hypothetical protein
MRRKPFSTGSVGQVAVTLRMANDRIIGNRMLAIPEWLHQEPEALGSRAVLHPGETWVGLIDADICLAALDRAATTPPPYRVVFAVTDADDNRYELDVDHALEFEPG